MNQWFYNPLYVNGCAKMTTTRSVGILRGTTDQSVTHWQPCSALFFPLTHICRRCCRLVWRLCRRPRTRSPGSASNRSTLFLARSVLIGVLLSIGVCKVSTEDSLWSVRPVQMTVRLLGSVRPVLLCHWSPNRLSNLPYMVYSLVMVSVRKYVYTLKEFV